MTFIRDIAALFQNKNIQVDIDPLLLPLIKSADKVTTQRIISFNLYQLIYHIGTIQSRRFAPSNRLKFLDKIDLIEKIYSNTNEFRIKINEIRQINGSETLISISEDFGIGISVVVAESLFNIKRSTIQKIYGTGRRPDWKCQLTDNRIFVAEGKGATSIATSNTQQAHALDQKTREPGDIRVASLTVLNEDTISTNRYLDPPIENDNVTPEMQNHILRAGHYASVFSFLGNSRLSRYYSQMRKRIEGIITSQEQNLKDTTFRELRFNDPTISFKEQDFVGSFYNIQNDKFLFVGVDKRLLSYQGFISYNEFESDVEETIQDNVFILYKDGVLVIEILNIDVFSDIVNISVIKNYQDNITISDIDEMNEISFSKYFEYILKENGFTNLTEQTNRNDLFVDLSATKGNQIFYFEFKLFRNKRIGRDSIQQISEFRRRLDNGKLILITNAKLTNTQFDNENIIIIDREKLDQLTKNSNLLNDLIE
jgi:Holliday junction resolvase